MSTTGHQSTSGHITMDILRCIEENELNQMIEDAGNTLAELNEGNVKYDVLQNAYNDAAKNLAKSLWSSIELAFINFAKDKCDGLIVPKERVVEFRRLAFPWNEYQGINLMLTRLEQFYLHESHQSPNEFDHYFDLTRQFIRNIKSMPQPDHEVLEQLNNRFRNSNTEN